MVWWFLFGLGCSDRVDNDFIFRILLARLEYLRETFQIKEGDFLTFDALVWETYSSICSVFGVCWK